MKIYASKVDDLKRAKAEYDEDFKLRQAKHDEEYEEYRKALRAVFEPVEKYLENLLASPVLEYNIGVEDARYGKSGLRVRIMCNESNREQDALRWSFDVELDDGVPVKESSSWSGLNATTPENLESLRATVDALEVLNNLDWVEILDKTLPNYEDYISEHVSRYGRPDFEEQIKVAQLEEIAGKTIAVKGGDIDQEYGYSPKKSGYLYFIHKFTPKQVYITKIWTGFVESQIEDGKSVEEALEAGKARGYEQRVKLDRLLRVLPDNLEFMGE